MKYVGPTALTIGLLSANATSQETLRVSVDSSGVEGNDNSYWNVALSADGQVAVFASWASNLVAGDTNQQTDVFAWDHVAGTVERVSVDSTGAEGNGPSGYFDGAISANGQIVAFVSGATNLDARDTNAYWDIYVHDRSTGVTECVSIDSSGAEGNGNCYSPSLSADGRIVAFASLASNLVSGDTNRVEDVFVHDRSTGMTERVSVDSSGAQGRRLSGDSSISADGRFVAFSSDAGNLVSGDTNQCYDVFVHDRSTGFTERVSVNSLGFQGTWESYAPSISADGQVVAFVSQATNLVPHDANSTYDVFVRDRTAGTTKRVSVDSSGVEANGYSQIPSISADGQVVAFSSNATNLVAGDTNGKWDVFFHDRSTGDTGLVSTDSAGGLADSDSGMDWGWDYLGLSISGSGQVVAFGSTATNLVANDTNGFHDVFVKGCRTIANWSNYGAGFPGTHGVPAFTARQNPVLGTTVSLDVENSWRNPTAGLLFVGFQQTVVPTNWGGDLLVVPSLTLPITFSYGADSFTGAIPNDWSLCGIVVDLQAFEADPGAAKGVSFTQGLELVLGR